MYNMLQCIGFGWFTVFENSRQWPDKLKCYKAFHSILPHSSLKQRALEMLMPCIHVRHFKIAGCVTEQENSTVTAQWRQHKLPRKFSPQNGRFPSYNSHHPPLKAPNTTICDWCDQSIGNWEGESPPWSLWVPLMLLALAIGKETSTLCLGLSGFSGRSPKSTKCRRRYFSRHRPRDGSNLRGRLITLPHTHRLLWAAKL